MATEPNFQEQQPAPLAWKVLRGALCGLFSAVVVVLVCFVIALFDAANSGAFTAKPHVRVLREALASVEMPGKHLLALGTVIGGMVPFAGGRQANTAVRRRVLRDGAIVGTLFGIVCCVPIGCLWLPDNGRLPMATILGVRAAYGITGGMIAAWLCYSMCPNTRIAVGFTLAIGLVAFAIYYSWSGWTPERLEAAIKTEIPAGATKTQIEAWAVRHGFRQEGNRRDVLTIVVTDDDGADVPQGMGLLRGGGSIEIEFRLERGKLRSHHMELHPGYF